MFRALQKTDLRCPGQPTLTQKMNRRSQIWPKWSNTITVSTSPEKSSKLQERNGRQGPVRSTMSDCSIPAGRPRQSPCLLAGALSLPHVGHREVAVELVERANWNDSRSVTMTGGPLQPVAKLSMRRRWLQ